MARIQLTFPEKTLFTTVLDVRITDLNYGGHLGNDSVLSLLHEARVRFLQYLGFRELDVAGTGIIMSDAAIQFKGEAFYGEQLTIAMAVADFSRVSFDLYYLVTNNDKTIALAKTGIVFFDYTQRKIVPVPEAFLLAVNR